MQLNKRDQRTLERGRRYRASQQTEIAIGGRVMEKMVERDEEWRSFMQLQQKIAERQEQIAKHQEQTTQILLQILQNMNNSNNSIMSAHNNGAKGSNSNQNGSKNHSSGVPRPTQPTFLPRVELTQEEEELNPTKNDFNACIDAYSRLDPDISRQIPFIQFHNARSGSRAGQPMQQFNKDIQHKVSKLTLPTFDGSGKVTGQAWVQKLDTYLSHSPMTEDEAIKFATHFDGIAHEWWQHGLITQGHHSVVTYGDFAQRLVDRFDRNDPELHFKKLAQLKQHGSIEEYVAEFQRFSVMVPDVTEMTLMFLFIEGLSESLRGWVRAFEPTSLQDAIRRALKLEESATKNKFYSKGVSTKQHTKPFQKDIPQPTALPPKQNKFEETKNELWREMWLSCKESWEPGHRCLGEGQIHYIEGPLEEDSESEENKAKTMIGEIESGSKVEEEIPRGTLAASSGVPTFRVRGTLQGHKVTVLINGGATHNFIDADLVSKKGLDVKKLDGVNVMLGNGRIIPCNGQIQQPNLLLGSYQVKDDFYVVRLGKTNVVLGMQWLYTLGKFSQSFQTMEFKFKANGKEVILRGILNEAPSTAEWNRLVLCMQEYQTTP